MPHMRETLRETFWVLALAVIVLFAFFAALGAFSPADALWADADRRRALRAVDRARGHGGAAPRAQRRPDQGAGAPRVLARGGTTAGRAARHRCTRDPYASRVLDHEIQPIVDLLNAAPGPPAHEIPVSQARAAHDRETEVMSGPGEEVAEVREVPAPGPGGPVPIRVFRPLGAGEGPLPLVAYLHGGGWVIGSLDGFDPLCRALANRSGAVVASVDYRLAPEHPFPAAPDDARAAVRWLHEQAPALGADPGRLAIAGDSAGANLADRDRPPAARRGRPAAALAGAGLPGDRQRAQHPLLPREGRRIRPLRGEHGPLLAALPRRRGRPPPGRLAAAGGRARRAAAGLRPDRRGRRAARRGGGLRAGARARGRVRHPASLRRADPRLLPLAREGVRRRAARSTRSPARSGRRSRDPQRRGPGRGRTSTRPPPSSPSAWRRRRSCPRPRSASGCGSSWRRSSPRAPSRSAARSRRWRAPAAGRS